MKRLISLMVVAILGTLPMAAQARHGRGFGQGRMPPALVKQALKDAGLSDQQIRRVTAIKDQTDREMLDLRHQVQKAHLDMRALMQAETPDQSAIYQQVDKIGALRLKMQKARIGMILAIRKEVTPGQWDKLSALFARHRMNRREKRRHRRERRMRKRALQPGSGGL